MNGVWEIVVGIRQGVGKPILEERMRFTEPRIYYWTLDFIRTEQRRQVFDVIQILSHGPVVSWDDGQRDRITMKLNGLFKEAW